MLRSVPTFPRPMRLGIGTQVPDWKSFVGPRAPRAPLIRRDARAASFVPAASFADA